MPPPEVGVVTVTPSAVAVVNELPGRLEGVRTAEVRARVEGIVLSRNYTEGGEVKAGQVLFRIDPARIRRNWLRPRPSSSVPRPMPCPRARRLSAQAAGGRQRRQQAGI
jgi:hypothetical protein